MQDRDYLMTAKGDTNPDAVRYFTSILNQRADEADPKRDSFEQRLYLIFLSLKNIRSFFFS